MPVPVGEAAANDPASFPALAGIAPGALSARVLARLADVAVGCTLGWLSFRFPDIAWRDDYPNLAKLYDKLSERQSFKDTVPA